MSRKKKSLATLGAAIAEHEKLNNSAPTSAVQQLVEAFLSTNNPAKRAKRIAEIKSRSEGLNALLEETAGSSPPRSSRFCSVSQRATR